MYPNATGSLAMMATAPLLVLSSPGRLGADSIVWRAGLQGLKQAAVDDEVSAGDVQSMVAGQEEHQVGYLLGTGETTRYHLAGSLAGNVLRRSAGRRAHGLGHSALAEPQIGSHRTGANGIDANSLGPTSLDSALQKLARAAFATL